MQPRGPVRQPYSYSVPSPLRLFNPTWLSALRECTKPKLFCPLICFIESQLIKPSPFPALWGGARQGVTKRCRLSWLTNSALVYEPKRGGRGGVAGSQPLSTAVQRSPNKLWRSYSIFNLWVGLFLWIYFIDNYKDRVIISFLPVTDIFCIRNNRSTNLQNIAFTPHIADANPD
jgi:hypothetical protein